MTAQCVIQSGKNNFKTGDSEHNSDWTQKKKYKGCQTTDTVKEEFYQRCKETEAKPWGR